MIAFHLTRRPEIVWDGFESFGKCFVEFSICHLSWIDLVTDILFVIRRFQGPEEEMVYGLWSLLFVITSWWALGYKTNMISSEDQVNRYEVTYFHFHCGD